PKKDAQRHKPHHTHTHTPHTHHTHKHTHTHTDTSELKHSHYLLLNQTKEAIVLQMENLSGEVGGEMPMEDQCNLSSGGGVINRIQLRGHFIFTLSFSFSVSFSLFSLSVSFFQIGRAHV